MPDSFLQRCLDRLRRVEIVTNESRKDVQVVVPHALTARRFVVLVGGYTSAPIDFLEREGHQPRQTMDPIRDQQGQVEEVLEMVRGNDQRMPGVLVPPVLARKARDPVIAIHDHRR